MTLSSPQHAVLMLQPRCNMTCSFCVTEDSMGTMSFEVAKLLLKNLQQQGFVSAIFGGGEPFYWPHDLKKILRYAKSLGLKTQIGTNATRFPEDFYEWDFVDRWVIPFDAASEKVHNTLRSFQERHWQVINACLTKLSKTGRSTTISTVVTQVNFKEIIPIGEYLRDLDKQNGSFIHAWHLYQFLPFGRGGKSHRSALEIPDAEYENIVSRAKELNLPFQVFKRKNMLMSNSVEFYWVENGNLMAQSKKYGLKKVALKTSE